MEQLQKEFAKELEESENETSDSNGVERDKTSETEIGEVEDKTSETEIGVVNDKTSETEIGVVNDKTSETERDEVEDKADRDKTGKTEKGKVDEDKTNETERSDRSEAILQNELYYYDSLPTMNDNQEQMPKTLIEQLIHRIELLEEEVKGLRRENSNLLEGLHSKLDTILAKKRRHQMGSGSATPLPTPLRTPVRNSPQPVEFPSDNGGCWLGNPLAAPESKDRVWVISASTTQEKVTEITSSTSSAKTLALRLLTTFFTEDELSRSNCTPATGREVLDQKILSGIRAHINYKYPCINEDEGKRWRQLVVGPLNSRCRTARAKRSSM